MVVFHQTLTLFVISLTMTEETAIETSIEPSSHLAGKKIWQRRLFVVIASAILTLGACTFLGMQFGSAEQVILTLMSLSVIALLMRVFRSKGRFRFASLRNEFLLCCAAQSKHVVTAKQYDPSAIKSRMP
jgi:cell division protein FtsW (lipid II flippase)